MEKVVKVDANGGEWAITMQITPMPTLLVSPCAPRPHAKNEDMLCSV